jgi:predicted GIY-YIG superfamily endonuclease
MHPRFAELANSLQPSFLRLTECPPYTGRLRLPLGVPRSGVYLFSEGDDHLYVGRTDRLRDRHKEHWSGKANDAPFAFKLARYATDNLFKGGRTRKALEADPAFAAAFIAAKERVSNMQFRWVEETDPNRQCLLEIYATVVLDARYNDFINH